MSHTCMYEITATHGRILFTVHTDDADCMFPIEDPPFSSLLPFVLAPLHKTPTATNRRYEVGVTSDLVTDMCMYNHAIVGVSPHDM